MNNRLASPDILKVAAIISVVLIHGSFIFPYTITQFELSVPQLSIGIEAFRFCVPVFILLFAYFQEKSFIKKGHSSVLPRLLKLFIPFFFWSMVYFLITADIKRSGISGLITKHWVGYGWSGQYYFIIIFQLLVVFPIIRWLMNKFKINLYVVLALSLLFYSCISYSNWMNIPIVEKISHRAFIYWIPYLVIGIIYAKNITVKIPVLIGILSIILIPLEVHFLHPQNNSLYLLPSTFLASFLLTTSILKTEVTYKNMTTFTGKSIQYIASTTLGIFCLNPLVILGLEYLVKISGFHLDFIGCSFIATILSTLLILSICITVIFMLKKLKLGILTQ